MTEIEELLKLSPIDQLWDNTMRGVHASREEFDPFLDAIQVLTKEGLCHTVPVAAGIGDQVAIQAAAVLISMQYDAEYLIVVSDSTILSLRTPPEEIRNIIRDGTFLRDSPWALRAICLFLLDQDGLQRVTAMPYEYHDGFLGWAPNEQRTLMGDECADDGYPAIAVLKSAFRREGV